LWRLDNGNGQERKTCSLTWSKWHFRGATLPSKPDVWRVFWPLLCFKVRVHLQPSVSYPGRGWRDLAKLQVSRKEVIGT